MNKVFKYPLYSGVRNDYFAELPKNCKVLSVGCQFGRFVVWAIVSQEEQGSDLHRFHIAGTGHELSSNPGEYLNRVDYENLHFHVFYRGIDDCHS